MRVHPQGCQCITCDCPPSRRPSNAGGDRIQVLRAQAMRAISAKPPASVQSGGVVASRDYKDRCAVLNRFARGGSLTPQVRAALNWFAAHESAGGPPLAGGACADGAAINFGGYEGAETSPVPVSNTGTTSTGRGV